jgi:predicted patatin/cPLA2 family phospholipase
VVRGKQKRRVTKLNLTPGFKKEAGMIAAQKSADQSSSRSSTATTAVTRTTEATRKPWKKKTPVDVMLDQIDRLREDVQKKEEELKQAKRQMQKLEEARKILEST